MAGRQIIYPRSWSQTDRDELDAMFVEARAKGLWFYINTIAHTGWFSPDELDAQQKAGRFFWGAVNWKLRDPRDYVLESEILRARADREHNEIASRVSTFLLAQPLKTEKP